MAAFLNNGKREQEHSSFQHSILEFHGFLVDLLVARRGVRSPWTTV